jgi:DNA polymerase-1
MNADWPAIRAHYESTGEPLRAVAELFDVPFSTLGKRAVREKWQRSMSQDGNTDGNNTSLFPESGNKNGNKPGNSEVLFPKNGNSNENDAGLFLENGNNQGNKAGLFPENGNRKGNNGSRFHIPAEINEWDRLTAARFYLERFHWAVHHLFPPDKGDEKVRGKRPWSKDWPNHIAADVTLEDLGKLLGPQTSNNLGVVVRPPFVAVDLDSKPDKGASVLAWLAEHPQFADVPRERTGGGVHLHFLCRDLPAGLLNAKKAPTVMLTPKVTAELYLNGMNLVVAPSIHKSGHRYTWEVTGDIPEVKWAQLCEWFGFEKPEEKRAPGRPAKEKPWWSALKGDLSSLDICALFHSAELLGECIDPDEEKWAVRCPWDHEHSTQSAGIGSDAVVFARDMPAFKCLHAHCHERSLEHVCLWFENREPGIVDRLCGQQRVWQKGQADSEGRPRIVLPGLDREDSQFAREIADVIAPKHIWFIKGNRTVSIALVRFSEKAESLGFVPVEPIEARTAVEDHLQTGIVQTDQQSGEPVFLAKTMTRECAAGMLAAPQFRKKLPEIIRILDLPLPIRLPDGDIAYPQPGYDARFRIYTDPTSPKITPMSRDEAQHWLREAHDGFGWLDAQSLVHQIARVITPYCRGLMGWDARFPLWHYSANRPRAGKDYLAGVAHMIYEGHSCEDTALEKEGEENRKRITTALMGGRRMFHLANCQGHISDPCFIGAITSKIFAARNLGSTDGKADLKLPNEVEFSLSANMGLTFRPDVEPRTRRISLTFAEENANARSFSKPDLWGWLIAHRSEMLSAIASLTKVWMDAGCPNGSTPFTSFPEWASVVGGIMQANDLGDPCESHLDDGGLPADRQIVALKALFLACHERHAESWITKAEIYDVIVTNEDNERFGWFGDLAEKGVKTKVSLQLRQFNRRELGGLVMQIDESAVKTQQHRYRFVTERTPQQDFVHVLFKRPSPPPAVPAKPSRDGHLGHVGHPVPSPSVQDLNNSNQNQKSKMNNISMSREDREMVPKVPILPKSELVTDRTKFAEIAALIRASGCLALDVETYGQRRGDGLDPWRGDIRLLSLSMPGRDPWMLDLRAIGYDLGELKDSLESCEIIAHNAKFDMLWLRVKCGLLATKVFCTLAAARLLTAGTKPGNDLDKCLERYLQIPPASDHSTSDWGSMFLTEDQLAYAARDVAHLHDLAAAQRHELETQGLHEVGLLEMRLVPAIVEMEAAGIAVYQAKLKAIHQQAQQSVASHATKLRELLAAPKLNPSSLAQLADSLKARGIVVNSTDEETLKAADDGSIIPVILSYRSAEKLGQQAKSLLDCVKQDGRIHGRFDPTGTATGRFSSKDPNLQNIGRGELRTCFVPAEGNKLIVADYSQIELRAAAAIAGETKMIEAYRRGEDLHRQTAAIVLGKAPADVTKADRQLAKAVNFGLLYGQYAAGLVRYAASSYGVTLELEQAEAIRKAFFRTYGALRQWHGESHVKAGEGIREVRTVSGRRRIIPPDASEWNRFTALVNTPVQGGCADGMKAAIVRLHHELPIEARLLSTVHDELIVEAPEHIASEVCEQVSTVMREAMEKLFPSVPIEVEAHVCASWGEKG